MSNEPRAAISAAHVLEMERNANDMMMTYDPVVQFEFYRTAAPILAQALLDALERERRLAHALREIVGESLRTHPIWQVVCDVRADAEPKPLNDETVATRDMSRPFHSLELGIVGTWLQEGWGRHHLDDASFHGPPPHVLRERERCRERFVSLMVHQDGFDSLLNELLALRAIVAATEQEPPHESSR